MAKKKGIPYLNSPDMRESKLVHITRERLQDLFGPDIPAEVEQRCGEELYVITQRGHIAQYLIAETIATEAKKLSMPVWFGGNIGSSFIAYLCGITSISPLPEKYGGVDIPFESTGEKYGNRDLFIAVRSIEPFIVMIQGILQEMYPEYHVLSLPVMQHPFSAEGYEAKYGFVPAEKDVRELVMDSFRKEVTRRKWTRSSGYDIPYTTLMCFEVSFTHEEDLMKVYMSGEKLQDEEVDLLSQDAVEQIWNYMRRVEELPEPYVSIPVRTIHDLVKVICLSHGTDVMDEVMINELITGKRGLSDVITSRDDLFLYLISKRFESRKAFELSEYVRKGRGLTKEMEADMVRLGVSEEVIRQCKNVKYLFLKAYGAEKVKEYAWMAQIDQKEAIAQRSFYEQIKKQEPLVKYGEGGLILIAGRPSMGKTSLALRIARDASVQQEKSVRYYYLESPSFDKRAQGALKGLSSDLFHIETRLMSVEEIIKDCDNSRSMGSEIGLIIVDFIQLTFGEPLESMRKLREYAERMNCPIIVTSQLNRSLEEREDKHPTEDDLPWEKENNSLFKQIMLIYRDSYYNVLSADRNSADRQTTEVTLRTDESEDLKVIILYMDHNKLIFENTVSE